MMFIWARLSDSDFLPCVIAVFCVLEQGVNRFLFLGFFFPQIGLGHQKKKK